MKIHKQSNQRQFCPYTINIEIESYAEELILQDIAKAQYTIPELLYPCTKPNSISANQFNLTQQFLNKLYIAIKS